MCTKDGNPHRCNLNVAIADYIGSVVWKWQPSGVPTSNGVPLVYHRYTAINGNAHNSFPTKCSEIICPNNCKCRISCSVFRCLSGAYICLGFFWIYLLSKEFIVIRTYIVLLCFDFLSFFRFFTFYLLVIVSIFLSRFSLINARRLLLCVWAFLGVQ